MNKKVFLILLNFVLVIGLTLVGCSKAAAPTMSPADTPAPAKTSDSTGEVYELSLAYGDIKSEFSYAELDGPDGWIAKLEEASGGRLKVSTVYYAGQLIADAEIYDAAVKGTVDIACNTASQMPNRFVIMDLLSIFSLGNTCKYPSKACMDLLHAYPDIFNENFKDAKLLCLFSPVPDPPGLPIGSVKIPIRKLDDLKGFKLAGPGKYNMDLLSALGASPTMVPPPEQYQAMQKGILDGVVLDPIFYEMLNYGDIIKYQTNITVGGAPWFIAMNLSKFNSLPTELQDVLIQTAAQYGDKVDAFGFEAKEAMVQKAVEEKGLELIDIGSEELAKLKQIEKPVWEKAVAEYAAMGLPAEEILDTYYQLRTKYN